MGAIESRFGSIAKKPAAAAPVKKNGHASSSTSEGKAESITDIQLRHPSEFARGSRKRFCPPNRAISKSLSTKFGAQELRNTSLSRITGSSGPCR